MRAINYYINQDYIRAEEAYQSILDMNITEPISSEDYGDILHNLAVIKSHRLEMDEVIHLLKEAYERNQKEESLKQYLLALRFWQTDEVFEQRIQDIATKEELELQVYNEVLQIKEEIERSDEMKQIKNLMKLKSQGNLAEYMKLSNELLEHWITDYRREL